MVPYICALEVYISVATDEPLGETQCIVTNKCLYLKHPLLILYIYIYMEYISVWKHTSKGALMYTLYLVAEYKWVLMPT